MNELLLPKPSQLITNTIQFTEYSLYLHGKIGEPDDFMEHFAVYKQARECDVVKLYIVSEGGSLATGMEYIRHMRECEAPIIAVLGVEVASMASAIALEADEIEVDEMSTMLIHSFSYGAMGTESAIFNQAQFNNKLNERWIRKHYSTFLTEDQLSDVFKGVDVLMDSDQILESWARLKQFREQQCSCEECEEMECTEPFDLMQEIDNRVAQGVEKALDKILKKYTLTEKPKPSRKTPSRKTKKALDEAKVVGDTVNTRSDPGKHQGGKCMSKKIRIFQDVRRKKDGL